MSKETKPVSIYPYMKGLEFGICYGSAGAEIKISDTSSLVPIVRVSSESFACEYRRYFESGLLYQDAFWSTRLSTRKNIGFGLGVSKYNRDVGVFTPSFGVSYSVPNGTMKPFISIGYSF